MFARSPFVPRVSRARPLVAIARCLLDVHRDAADEEGWREH